MNIVETKAESQKLSPPGQYAELLSTLVIWTLLQKLQDVHGSVEVATGQTDADCCLMFVPCQNPYFDPCQPQSLNGLLDFVLESGRENIYSVIMLLMYSVFKLSNDSYV